MKPLRVYVAGPYTADSQDLIDQNVQTALDAGIDLLLKGHAPFIPHLTGFVDLRAKQRGIAVPWDAYIDWDLQWLRLCDAVLYLGPSKGADVELEFAKQLGLRIFDSLSEIPSAATPDASS